MKIIFSDFKNGEAKLQIENLDDLWYLSQIIEVGDILAGHTYRKIKLESGQDQKSVKKRVFLKIKAEKIEFNEYSNMLKVNGTVMEGPEDVPNGSYHSFNLEEDVTFKLQKEKFLSYQVQKLKEAADTEKKDILVCIFDREDAIYALLSRKGFEVLTELHGDVAKKDDRSLKGENFFQRIVKVLEEYDARFKTQNIILASPAFWKDELAKELKDDDLKRKIVFANCSSVTREAINEILKREEIKGILKKDRIARETEFVEQLLREIAKQNLAVYGLKQTSYAIEMGAVSVLLVSDSLIRRLRTENKFSHLEFLMRTVDSMKGDVHIISTDSEAGKKLAGLGGIAGILRYKMS